MLAIERSTGVAPEVNLREHVTSMSPPSANKAEQNSGFENPEEKSPEVQNRGISGHTKKDSCAPKEKICVDWKQAKVLLCKRNEKFKLGETQYAISLWVKFHVNLPGKEDNLIYFCS